MDLFSKFAQNYIINNKDKNTLLDKIDFLLKNMEKINILHRRYRHLQIQGKVERFIEK